MHVGTRRADREASVECSRSAFARRDDYYHLASTVPDELGRSRHSRALIATKSTKTQKMNSLLSIRSKIAGSPQPSSAKLLTKTHLALKTKQKSNNFAV